jgi:peptide/nickel transport system substrate-binding protein
MKRGKILWMILLTCLLVLGLGSSAAAEKVRREDMKRGKILWMILLTCLLVLGLGSSAAAEKVLNIGIKVEDMGILDPHLSASNANIPIMNSVFNGLVRFKPGNDTVEAIEPDLAARWKTSRDGKVWTFYLRKGVQFHHGFGEMTADDVVFSLKKAATMETSAWHLSYQEIKNVEALDRYTVQITLDTPNSLFLGVVLNYHGGMVLCKKAVEKYGDKFKLNPVGTGPFAFKEYFPRQRVELVANEKYFRGRPKLDKVIYHFVPLDQTREMALLKGELDMMTGIRQDWWVDKARNNKVNTEYKNVIVDIVPPGEMSQVHFNLNIKPLDNLKVRQALCFALDPKEFRIALGGFSATEDALSPVPRGYLGYTDDVPRYGMNLEKAKALLREAGYPNGFTLADVTTSTIYLNRIELIQSQLSRIGVKFSLKMADHPTVQKMMRGGELPIVISAAARFPTADQALTEWYHSKSAVGTPSGLANYSYYGRAIPGVDDLIDKARVETDKKKQIELWHDAQRKIMTDVPAYPLYTLYFLWARNNNVELGYELKVQMSALFYPITEKTDIKKK